MNAFNAMKFLKQPWIEGFRLRGFGRARKPAKPHGPLAPDYRRWARERAVAIKAKFQKVSRQQRRRSAFRAAFAEINEKYGPEPRAKRRRMARGLVARGKESRP